MNLPELVIPSNFLAKRPKFLIFICRKIFNLLGWRALGNIPRNKNFLVAVGPHTSNWDFVIGMLFVIGWDARINWIGKHTIFQPLFSPLLKRLGGLPVDRSNPENLFNDIKNVIKNHENYLLAIAPEGTRKKVHKLKTGFLRISDQLQCEILLAGLDFGSKTITINDIFKKTGSLRSDTELVKEYFKSFTPKKINNF